MQPRQRHAASHRWPDRCSHPHSDRLPITFSSASPNTGAPHARSIADRDDSCT
ncbi:MAG: hypothetical protein OXI29_05975 [bacterium]|nr:hypothetical protein [bacterium]